MPIPETFTLSPASNWSTVSSSPIWASAGLVAELDQLAHRAGAPAFFRWPSSALVSRALLDRVEGELDGRVAVALGLRTAVTVHGPASITVTGTRVPSSRKTCVMPTFLPTIAAISSPRRR